MSETEACLAADATVPGTGFEIRRTSGLAPFASWVFLNLTLSDRHVEPEQIPYLAARRNA